ncbi:MAG: NUDIX domain-containing protein [Paludibacter sp.]|nr:NUDIX domain-containing protein [Paludibacter sp.]
MKKHRKQINESFFNPLLHFIPLLLFLVIDDIFGYGIALSIINVVVIAILIYSHFLYRNLYTYLGLSYLISTGIIATIIFFPHQYLSQTFHTILSETIVFFSLVTILILRNRITRFVSTHTPKHLAMTNNLYEHFRIVWMLTVLFFIYITSTILVSQYLKNNHDTLLFIRESHLVVLIFIITHEIIRVSLIRIKLFKEVWLPIVNEDGQVIGSVQEMESIKSDNNFLHPVIRVFLINDGKVFLQQHSKTDTSQPHIWDVALSNHVRMNETVEQCIERSSLENYNISDIKPLLLSKHIRCTKEENQFVYLFLICKMDIQTINTTKIENVKWWTITQIQNNIGSGIFSSSFESEFEILKRSGFIDNGNYNCSCALKDAVYQGIIKQ